MGRTPVLPALLALLGSLVLAGCVEDAPARSVPLESIAPRPPPVGFDHALVVGYDLERIDVATLFAGAWNETGERALARMGYVPAQGSTPLAFEKPDGPRIVVEPLEDGSAFWLNATYDDFRVFAPTLPEAHQLADAAWREEEPEFLGTVAAFEQRTGWPLADAPLRTNAFAARFVPMP